MKLTAMRQSVDEVVVVFHSDLAVLAPCDKGWADVNSQQRGSGQKCVGPVEPA